MKRGEKWKEYIPVEQTYTDFLPEEKVEMVPVEQTYTDFIEIAHDTEYIPVQKYKKRIEYIPVEAYDEYTDYIPVQKQTVTRLPSGMNNNNAA